MYDLPPEEEKKVPTVCFALAQALNALSQDREFLKAGGVFTDDTIHAYAELKMEEVIHLRMLPRPIEFDLYYSLYSFTTKPTPSNAPESRGVSLSFAVVSSNHNQRGRAGSPYMSDLRLSKLAVSNHPEFSYRTASASKRNDFYPHGGYYGFI